MSAFKPEAFAGGKHDLVVHPNFPAGMAPGQYGCCEVCTCRDGMRKYLREEFIPLVLLWAFSDGRRARHEFAKIGLRAPTELDVLRGVGLQ